MLSVCKPEGIFVNSIANRFQKNQACGLWVYVVYAKTQTNSFGGPGPGRTVCVLALGRHVFFGGRSREPKVLDRFRSESAENLSPIVPST